MTKQSYSSWLDANCQQQAQNQHSILLWHNVVGLLRMKQRPVYMFRVSGVQNLNKMT